MCYLFSADSLAWQFKLHDSSQKSICLLGALIGLFSMYKGHDDLGTGHFLRIDEHLRVHGYQLLPACHQSKGSMGSKVMDCITNALESNPSPPAFPRAYV